MIVKCKVCGEANSSSHLEQYVWTVAHKLKHKWKRREPVFTVEQERSFGETYKILLDAFPEIGKAKSVPPEFPYVPRTTLSEARELLSTAQSDWERELYRQIIITPSDEFELAYDKERNPQC